MATQATRTRDGQGKTGSIRNRLLLTGAFFSAIMTSTAVLAEDSAKSNDIIVTAQFRSENLQQTPLAITAVNSAMLDARGITNVTEAAQAAPNVTLAPSTSSYGKGLTAFIRGVGQFDINPAFEPGVGVYIDDVYYSTVYGSAFDLVDPDRIEVLRGPQGTLSGKNSIGGAIKLYSKKPTGDSDGDVSLSYGSFQKIEARANADFSLVPDKVFVRISGLAKAGGGYVKNLDYGCLYPSSGVPATGATTPEKGCKLEDAGDENIVAGRVYLRAVPTENLELSVIADVTKDFSNGIPETLVDATPGLFADLTPFLQSDPFVTYSTYNTVMETGAPVISVPPRNRADNWGLSGIIDYDLGNGFSLKSITAYRQLHGEFNGDTDATPIAGFTSAQVMDADQFSQELRLNGSIGDLLDFTVGGYYFKGNVTTTARVRAFLTFDQEQADTVSNESKAAFAHAELHITPELSAIGGIRYTDDKKVYTFHRRNALPFDYGFAYLAPTLDGAGGTYAGDRVDWRVGLNYQITPSVMVYGQIATGYKGGGVNPRPFFAEQALPFLPETMTSYEVGIKSQFADNRVRLNLAGFYSDYSNLQVKVGVCTDPAFFPVGYTGPQFCSLMLNASSATIKGLEAETTIEPVDGFTIDGSLGYIDFKYGDGANSYGLGAVAPYTPKWTISMGAQYEVKMGSAGSITPRLDWMYRSSVYDDVQNNPVSYEPGRNLFNGRLTWKSAENDWELSLSVSNIFDKRYYLNKQDAFLSVFGQVTGVPGRPREFDVSIKRNF